LSRRDDLRELAPHRVADEHDPRKAERGDERHHVVRLHL
jgi:hypothetical protein